ncbi:MAG TPA: class I SAM-dependent RNA methyltransferase [Myxococcaceae bacterium]|nr:class I SAM-dependent RNA methyltransferase [Myxococcaceae bacterium]
MRLSQLGEGAGEHDGRTVFVAGALPGERVRVGLREEQRVLRGELLEVLEPSPARRTPPCPIADRCGGCDWLHLDEATQRKAKEEILLSALERLGRIPRSEVRLLPTVQASTPMSYRRRAVLHPSRGGLGFFGRKSHQLVPVEVCGALVGRLADLPSRLSPLLEPIRGDLSEVSLLAAGEQASFAAVLKGPVRAKVRETCERAVRELHLAGAVIVAPERAPELIGRPTLRARAPARPDVPLYLRPDGFAQAHQEANELLVDSALATLAPSSADRALELYAGNGNFTFALAARVKELAAVEASSLAVELGRRSTLEGGIANVRWVLGDAGEVVDGLVREGRRFDLLLADPPRTGAPGLGARARSLGVRRVVYVGCDAASLARDGADLREAGFAPSTVQLVDMFPQTHHLEAVMAFDRRGG